MNELIRWKELWLKLRATQIAAVALIATVMSIAGTQILIRGHFEDAGSGMLLSSRNLSSHALVPASLVAWLILAPLLNKRKFWVIIPAGIVAPFLGSAGFLFGLFFIGGPLGLLPATGITFVAWTFIMNSMVVMLPTSLITAILIWGMLKIGYSEAV
ncbi:MAG: hypothetical protein Q8T11_09310 [Elusimicrobiota bacterium]|nr:hypothetical protein [Elusimicrobiota bacterium]